MEDLEEPECMWWLQFLHLHSRQAGHLEPTFEVVVVVDDHFHQAAHYRVQLVVLVEADHRRFVLEVLFEQPCPSHVFFHRVEKPRHDVVEDLPFVDVVLALAAVATAPRVFPVELRAPGKLRGAGRFFVDVVPLAAPVPAVVSSVGVMLDALIGHESFQEVLLLGVGAAVKLAYPCEPYWPVF